MKYGLSGNRLIAKVALTKQAIASQVLLAIGN
jgi:hypothetical protein